jgi:deoxycytidine triphosphate deaminase
MTEDTHSNDHSPDAAQPRYHDFERLAERTQAITANRALPYATSDSEAEEKYFSTRSQDPFLNIPPALLNSADIASYVAATGMIFPFYPDKLKTASYPIAAHGRYLTVDKDGKRQTGELMHGETLILRRNSILFLNVEPYFRLPDYIALRHNLKIGNIYKGLLVGTGPLVDPGFVGRLALPLHNLTNQDYPILGGEGIIWVEFTKLSPNVNWTKREEDSRSGKYPPYNAELTKNRTVADYITQATGGGILPASSMQEAIDTASKARRTATKVQKNVRTFQVLAAFAIVATVYSILQGLVGPLLSTNDHLREDERRITNLENQIRVLQGSASPGQTGSPPTNPSGKSPSRPPVSPTPSPTAT